MWRKPFVWLAGCLCVVSLGAAAAYGAGLADPLLEKLSNAQPIEVAETAWLTGPELGPQGYVLPAESGASESDLKGYLEKPSKPSGDFAGWLSRHGAVSVGAVVWQVTLVGGLSAEVVVVGLRPVLDGSCTPAAPGGTLVEAVSEGVVGQAVFDTDIDAKDPVFVLVDVDAKRKPAFTDTVLKVVKGERHVLLFRANSRGPHCRFRIEVNYHLDRRMHTMMLAAPGGRPFEVTGYAAYKWVYRPPIVCGKAVRVAGEGWEPKSTRCS